MQLFGVIFIRIHDVYKITTPWEGSRLVIYRTEYVFFKMYVKKGPYIGPFENSYVYFKNTAQCYATDVPDLKSFEQIGF